MIRPVRRIVATSLVFAALAAGGETVALAASGASTPISKAEAVAFVQAVNLRVSDLPGAEKSPLGVAFTPNHSVCARPRTANHPIAVQGTSLIAPHGIVLSAVQVMSTEAVAAAELSALASHRGRVCFANHLAPTVTGEGEKTVAYVPIKVTSLRLTNMLGVGAIGFHVLSRPPKTHVTGVHTDGVIFRVGPAEILFLTFGGRQFPPATEGRLLSLLYSRAEANRYLLRPILRG